MEITESKKDNKGQNVLAEATNLFANGEPLRFLSIGRDIGKFGEYASEHVLHNRALTNLSYITSFVSQ